MCTEAEIVPPTLTNNNTYIDGAVFHKQSGSWTRTVSGRAVIDRSDSAVESRLKTDLAALIASTGSLTGGKS